MKTAEQQMPLWLAYVLLGGLTTILVLMPFHALISTWGGTAIGPLWLWKSWKDIAIAALALMSTIWIVSTPKIRSVVFRDKLALLVGSFVFYTLLMAFVHRTAVGLEATMAGVGSSLRYFAAAFVAYSLFSFSALNYRKLSKIVLAGMVIVGAFVSLLGLLQVTVLPRDLLENFGYEKNVTIAPSMVIDENPDAPRAFATLRGPNEFGAFLIIPLVIAIAAFRRSAWGWIAIAFIALGIFLSASRSAMIGAVVGVLSVFILTYGSGLLRSRKFIYGSVVALFLAVLLLVSAVSVPALRLLVFRSSPDDTSLTEGSTEQHFTLTRDGIYRVVENPIGCGPGCAGPASYYSDAPKISENYYVQVAEELGVAGLALWLAIAAIAAKRLYKYRSDVLACSLLASLAGLSVIGLWLHVWADDPLAITWWMLAGAVLGYNSRSTWKKSKNNSPSKT